MRRKIACFYAAAVRLVEHDGVEHSGYMSFMVLLSIFPFLIFLLALTSFLGAAELAEKFIVLLIENMPEKATDAIKSRIDELVRTPPQSLLTLAVVGSVWTASSFVECLRTILNRVYEVKSPPPYIRRRLLSILQFLLISVVITLLMFLLVVIPLGLAKIPTLVEIIDGYELPINLLRYFLILLLFFLGSASLYYIIPNIQLKFSEVIPGSILTVTLWLINGYLLSRYIVYYSQLNVVYGSLGSIIITLIFFYITNMIFIYGAEFNYQLKIMSEKKAS